jgi:N utilization substance protein B
MSDKPEKKKKYKAPTEAQQLIAKRRVARKLALIAVYQWQMTGDDYESIYGGFQQDADLAADLRKADVAFLHALARCAISEALNDKVEPYLENRSLQQVDMIEQAVLRIATCELVNHIETPYKVVVNEAMNLSKKFGAVQGHKYINGVLEKVITDTRGIELAADAAKSNDT